MALEKSFSDEEVIEGIRKGSNAENAVLEFLYATHIDLVRGFVLKNNGSDDEAKDVFQDGIIGLYKAIKAEKFRGESTVKSYLFSICKFIWFNRLKKQKRTKLYIESEEEKAFEYTASPIVRMLDKERHDQILNLFSKLGESCKEVLRLRIFLSFSLKEIAEKLSLASEQVAKNSHSRCKKRLRELVADNEGVRQLLQEIRMQ